MHLDQAIALYDLRTKQPSAGDAIRPRDAGVVTLGSQASRRPADGLAGSVAHARTPDASTSIRTTCVRPAVFSRTLDQTPHPILRSCAGGSRRRLPRGFGLRRLVDLSMAWPDQGGARSTQDAPSRGTIRPSWSSVEVRTSNGRLKLSARRLVPNCNLWKRKFAARDFRRHAPQMSRGDGRNDPADRPPPPQAAEISCYSVAEEIMSICVDFLVELRGSGTSDPRAAGHPRPKQSSSGSPTDAGSDLPHREER